MSAYGLQKAVAMLIRLPDANRGDDLETFIERYELTPHEQGQVRKLAINRSVTKFGHIMGSSRERRVTALISLSRGYITEDLLKRLWRQCFEPSAIHVEFNRLPVAFIHFLVENEEANRLLRDEAPPFVPDMLRFEMALAKFRMKHFSAAEEPPRGSLLKTMDFVTLSVDYDIQKLRGQLIREKKTPGAYEPEARKANLLFIRSEPFDCRVFEIDEPTKDFLDSERLAPGRVPPPASFADLQGLGIC